MDISSSTSACREACAYCRPAPGQGARRARAIRATLRAAIRAGGSSLRDYVGADGGRGDAQSRHSVYEREGKACRRCAAKVKRVVQGARSTYYCPGCQKKK